MNAITIIHYNRLSYEMKGDLINFSTKISRGLKRPQQKFIHRMMYGILAGNTFSVLFKYIPFDRDSGNWYEKEAVRETWSVQRLIFGVIATIIFCKLYSKKVRQIFWQQITTGFYEEIVYRGFVLEGYFEQENRNWKQRLPYASLSFCLFGLIHIVDGDLYTFFFTGILGFAFATIYIKLHNIFIPMIFHFVYDIFANMNSYIEYKSTIIFNSLSSII